MKIEILNFCIFQALLFFYCSNLKLCHSTDIFELIPEKNGKLKASKKDKITYLFNFFQRIFDRIQKLFEQTFTIENLKKFFRFKFYKKLSYKR